MGNSGSRAKDSSPKSSRYHREDFHRSGFDLLETSVGECGSNCVVRLARRKGQELAAVKIFDKERLTKEQRARLSEEIVVFLTLDHPRIVQLQAVYETDREVYLVMEYLQGGELFERMSEQGRYTEAVAAATITQMLEAVSYLHSKKCICHRDLKPENFVYEQKVGQDGSNNLKLIDFGTAAAWDARRSPSLSDGAFGTRFYMAPEVGMHQEHSEKCDMWSLGVISYELLTGISPWKLEQGQLRENPDAEMISRHQPFGKKRFLRLSEEARAFVESLLKVNPNERPSAEEALKDPWIASQHRGEVVIDQDVVVSIRHLYQTSRFRRVCLSLLAWSLGGRDLVALREDFMKHDEGSSGTVSLQRMKVILQENFSINTKEAQDIFHGLGAEWGGEIDYKSFLAEAMHDHVCCHRSALEKCFMEHGTKGIMTVQELRERLYEHSRCAHDFSVDVMERCLHRLDQGGRGEVKFNHFYDYLRKPSEDPEYFMALAMADAIQLQNTAVMSFPGTIPDLTKRDNPVSSFS